MIVGCMHLLGVRIESTMGGGRTSALLYCESGGWCVLEDHMNIADENKHGLRFVRLDISLLLKGVWGYLRG